MTETQQRFLQAIVEHVPLDRMSELHLFPSMRQGAIETGVAVVAALPAEDAEAGDRERHVVFSAHYRLTLKGSERGRWEASVVAEADAPLVTIDAVVRGVHRRAGELDPPQRLTVGEVRTMLDERPWPATTS